jgi:hypothetical protein
MSAYDNPTIIRDDSAMIWAQALGSAGQSFTESFNIARKEREAKEKEARLAAERKAKEEKEQTINNQIYSSEERYKYQTRMAKIDDGLVKAGVSSDGTELVNGFLVSTGEINGKNNVEIKTKVLSKEDLDKKNAYAAQAAKGEENLVRVAGGLYSQAQAIKSGELNDSNISNIKFKGDNILDQTLNRVTAFALAYPDNEKTTKKLDYDANGDPSKITLNITSKIGDYNSLIKTFKDTNPGVSQEEIDTKINEGISKGFIVKGDNDQYSVNFKKDINSDYDGELYTKIPEIEYGKAPVTAGVYSKENDTEVSTIYMKPTEYIDVEGNANLNKDQGTVKYQRTPIDIEAIRMSLKPSLQAKAQGLIASSFQDPDTADGILAKLGFGTNYQSKEFAKLDLATKVNLLASKMEKNEVDNIIKKSQLTLVDGKYYKMDPESIRIFNEESKKGGGGKSKAAKPTFDEVSSRIYAIQPGGPPDDFTWGNKKVSFDGINFVINSAGPNKDMAFSTKEEVINYLKTGKIK